MNRQNTRIKPSVTLFSDASVFHNDKRAGYGVWMKGDDRPSMKVGGPIEFVSSVMVAEGMAMLNGLVAADRSGYFRPSDTHIMLQSDCLYLLRDMLYLWRSTAMVQNHANSAPISASMKTPSVPIQRIVSSMGKILDSHEMIPILRHVRGHKSGGGRNWVNRECDRMAKDGAMRGIHV